MFYALRRIGTRPRTRVFGPDVLLTGRNWFRGVVFALATWAITTAGIVADEFPDHEPLAANQPRPPATAAAAAMVFSDPGGDAGDFRATAFAAEPDVQNPIDLAWDGSGRLWIAENYTYASRELRFRDDLFDRVVILDDIDLDGRFDAAAGDRRTVFMDGLNKLTSVEVGRGGVWLMTPPNLLFVPDADGDGVPDGPARVVLDGFTIAEQNYHNFANGLRFGPDGWLYGRCGGSCPGRIGVPGTADEMRTALEGGIWRFNVDTGQFEVLCHGTTNPWGHDFNEVGELFFINTVNGHLWHGIHGAHFKRPFTLDPNPNAYNLIDQHADHYHFDTGADWTKSRDGAANDFGGGHAHSGMMIYQETTWPESHRGDLMTLNFHGRRANRERLTRTGTGYVGSHQPDFCLVDDVWFRGMELTAGPDGNVVVADWSDLGECHEHTGVHRNSGRIYKWMHRSSPDPGVVAEKLVRLQTGDVDSLVDFQFAHDRWYSHQARLRLTQMQRDGDDVSSTFARLRSGVTDANETAAVRLRCLWTLHGIGGTDRDGLIDVIHGDENGRQHESVRAWAIRLLTESWPIDDVFGPTPAGVASAARVAAEYRPIASLFFALCEGESSGLVRGTLASTLQRLPLANRVELAMELARVDEADIGDHNQEKLLWYALMPLADANPAALTDVVVSSHLPELNQTISRAIAERVDSHPAAMDRLLVELTDAIADDPAWASSVFTGIERGLVGVRNCPPVEHWAAFESAIESSPDFVANHASAIAALRSVFGQGVDPAELLATVQSDDQPILDRLAAYQGLVDAASAGAAEMVSTGQLLAVTDRLIRDARINVRVAESATQIPDPAIARSILQHLNRFRAPLRPGVIGLLCLRGDFAGELMTAIESGQLNKSSLTASHVRSILALGDESLTRRLETAWGKLRDAPADQQAEIERLQRVLTPAALVSANLPEGRMLYEKSCSACHQLYGVGGKVGPDLTGAQRDNLDYWLANIVSPGAVVGADYRATKVLTADGRVLVGLVTQRTRQTITLVAADQTWVLPLDDIEDQQVTDQSPMPSGLLQPLSDSQIANLIGYLRHPVQVSKSSDAAE